MLAVIETGGKQYLVAPGDKVKIEKIKASSGDEVVFDKVLLKEDGGNVEIGHPYIAGAGIKAKVLSQGRADKVIVFRYHSKNRYRKKKGHRQDFTEVEISK